MQLDGASSSRRGGSGLGRGLAGILGEESTDAGRSEGLSTLFRSAPSAVPAVFGSAPTGAFERIRSHVIGVAVDTIASAFGLDGLVVIAAGSGAGASPLALRLPPGLAVGSPFLLEFYGRLWQRLDDRTASSDSELIGATWIRSWRLHADSGSGDVVVGVFRSSPLAEPELGGLERSLKAVAAMAGPEPEPLSTVDDRPAPSSVTATISSKRPLVSAEVTIALDGDASLTGTAKGETMVSAIAAAAANACRPQVELLFAGSSELDGRMVTVVLVEESGSGPVLGLSVRPVGDHTGPAEAVFAAVGRPDTARRRVG